MGTVDIYHSRRTDYEECVYWIRDEGIRNPVSEWVSHHEPEDIFYAREEAPEYNRENQVGNKFMFDNDSITLSTNDDIDKIKRGCIVKYNNDLWLVTDVQRQKHKKEAYFDNESHYTYYINLRK